MIQKVMGLFGLRIVRVSRYGQADDILTRMWRKGFQPSSIIDVGASDGSWTVSVMPLFSRAHYLLIEPREEEHSSLESLALSHPNIQYSHTLVSDKVEKLHFNQHGHQSSIFGNVDGQRFGDSLELQSTTLDNLIENMHIPIPQFIKLDVQGAELKVLTGAAGIMKSGELECVLAEVSFTPFQQGIPLAHELVVFMAQRKFIIYDVYDLVRRTSDGTLLQCMIIFLHTDSALLKNSDWGGNVPWS